MTDNERMRKMLDASPYMKARIDEILEGRDIAPSTKHEEDTRMITFTEAAKRLNLSRPTVYRLVRLGRLDARPLDGVSRIRLKSLFDFANGLRTA